MQKSQGSQDTKFNGMLKPITSSPESIRQRSATSGASSSRASISYTPTSNSTSRSSVSTNISNPNSGTGSNHIASKPNIQTQGSLPVFLCPTVHTVPTRVIFGVQGARRSLEIEQIEVFDWMNDQVFFSELKARYRKHRSLFWRLLSPFQFRHCNFVKVRPFKL